MSTTRVDVRPALPLDVYLRRPRPQGELPFPLAEPSCRLFSKSRHALSHGAAALGIGAGDEVLVPAYHHGSEIEALLRVGAELRFYDATANLEPDEAELEALRSDRTKALVLTHYMGFAQPTARWRRWCDDRGLLLIEDAAQSWLASTDDGAPVGSLGDLSFFCLYKTLALPDGSASVSRTPAVAPTHDAGSGAGRVVRAHGRWLAMRSPLVVPLGGALSKTKTYDPSQDFAFGDGDARPHGLTSFLLRRLATPDAASRRHANYATLLDRLGDLAPTSFRELPAGAAPHSFAVETERRDEVVAELQAEGIQAFAFWSFAHPALDFDRFPGAAERRRRIVILPVHQELRPADVTRIGESAERILRRR